MKLANSPLSVLFFLVCFCVRVVERGRKGKEKLVEDYGKKEKNPGLLGSTDCIAWESSLENWKFILSHLHTWYWSIWTVLSSVTAGVSVFCSVSEQFSLFRSYLEDFGNLESHSFMSQTLVEGYGYTDGRHLGHHIQNQSKAVLDPEVRLQAFVLMHSALEWLFSC